jgi:uncharacterized membrane protein YcaP (DUF421 family)
MEIVIRAAIIFVFLLVLTRALGKRTLAELSPFELILLVVIGDLVQGGVTGSDSSLTGAFLAAGTLAFCVAALSLVSYRFKPARSAIEGMPAILISDGEVIDEALRVERMPREALITAARQQQIEDLRDVKLAVLEANGMVSFIERDREPNAGTKSPGRVFPPSGGGS